MALQLKGQTGSTLDAERRTLASLNIQDAAMAEESLETGTLTWTVRAEDIELGDTIVPDEGQRVSLYEGETRLFAGHVTDVTVLLYGLRVTVSDPWWWLSRPDATSEIEDGEGSTGERPTVVFDEGDIAAHVEAVIDLARDGYGLPVAWGGSSTTYDIPKTTYSLSSLADVIARLLEWCADAVGWCDHSALSGETQAATSTTIELAATASATDDEYNGREIEIRSGANAGETRVIADYDGGTRTATVSSAWTTTPGAGDDYVLETAPAFTVTRRDDATAETYTVGTDPITGLEVRKRVELEVTRVALPYVDRDPTTGRTRWQLQEAGTGAAETRQIVPISGPELADFLPFDDFDSVEMQTAPITQAGVEDFALARGSQFTAALADGLDDELEFPATSSVLKEYATSAGDASSGPYDETYTAEATEFVDEDGNAVSTTGRYLVMSDRVPDWMIDQLGLIKVYASGEWLYEFLNSSGDDNEPADVTYSEPAWLDDLDGQVVETGYRDGTFPYDWDLINLFAGTWSIEGWLSPTAYGTATDVYRDLDYGFVHPPAGLAASMLAAANWTPWEGEIELHLDSIPTDRLMGRKFRVAGTLAAAATADALPRAIELDLARRVRTIRLGPPVRNDYRTLVGRTRRNPQDNIIEL